MQTTTETIAQDLNYDGDKISQAFFDALHDANFHYEAIILEKAWHAMANTPYTDSSDAHKFKDAVRSCLSDLPF